MCSSSEASGGVSASTGLFSNLATCMSISQTVSNSRLTTSWDYCYLSCALIGSSLMAYCSTHSTLMSSSFGSTVGSCVGYGDWLTSASVVRVYTIVRLYLRMNAQSSDLINSHTKLTQTFSQINGSYTDSLCNTKWVSKNTHENTYLLDWLRGGGS